MNTLKAFEMDDEQTIYAAEDKDEACRLYLMDMGDDFDIDDDYPQELTGSQLDHPFQDCDENEVPNGLIITIRQILAEKLEGGFLCGGAS